MDLEEIIEETRKSKMLINEMDFEIIDEIEQQFLLLE